MPIDIADLFERLRAGIVMVPAALWAVILLTGPTAAWLLYRFVVAPRATRVADEDLNTMWVCANCRSVNELRLDRCYRCDARPNEEEIEVIEAIPVASPLVAVGPGLDLDQPARVPPGRRVAATSMAPRVGQGLDDRPVATRPVPEATRPVTEAPSMPTAPPAPEPRDEPVTDIAPPPPPAADAPARRRTPRRGAVPVGPGRPDVGSPRRAVVAGQAPTPDDPSAA